MYRVQEFARLARVTVRTLHHYDRLGLLKPAARSPTGYRLYCDSDLERLEQITGLKYCGLSLREIRQLLKGPALDLRDALEQQRAVLAAKQRELGEAIRAIEQALHDPSANLTRMIEVMNMQSVKDWLLTHYSEGARRKLAAREWTPEQQADIERRWRELSAETTAAGEDPVGSERGQALEARRQSLIDEFTQGDPEIVAGLLSVYAKQEEWPAELREKMKGLRGG